MEPRELISTYCRGCGDHYSVAAAERETSQPHPPARPALAELVRTKLLTTRPREVSCHECGRTHAVAPSARFAQCPGCGTEIDLRDIVITTHSTRVVRTLGTVHVEREGFLNATRLDCGHVFVEGRIAGKVTCGGTMRLRGEGICRALIRTRRLMVDRGGPLVFPSTIHAEEVIIRCAVEADIVCAGKVHVGRHGRLTGDVQARSLMVDKGAAFSGDVEIVPGVELPSRSPRELPEVRVAPAWAGSRLAFG